MGPLERQGRSRRKKGPATGSPCSGGTPSSSNAQHQWIDSVVAIFDAQTALNGECGVAFGPGTIHLTGAISGSPGLKPTIANRGMQSAIGPDFIFDNVENNTGGSIIRCHASGECMTLGGAWNNGESSASLMAELSDTVQVCGFAGPEGYGLFCNSANAITSSRAGGTMASSGPNGISAGSCTTGLSGSADTRSVRPIRQLRCVQRPAQRGGKFKHGHGVRVAGHSG